MIPGMAERVAGGGVNLKVGIEVGAVAVGVIVVELVGGHWHHLKTVRSLQECA